MPAHISSVPISNEAQTTEIAAFLASISRPGDVLLLDGEIGAGKSFFSRAFIRALCGPETEVPSPTFTLVQVYDSPKFEIWHCDLYRLIDPDEAIELGLNAAFETSVVLIEWPDRLGQEQPESALRLKFSWSKESRQLELFGSDLWAERLEGYHAYTA